MKARLIYNPTSGQELIKKSIADILNELESYGYETSAFATTAEKDSARNEAERASKADYDLIVAAGGDGTLNEVVNGMMTVYRSKRPKFALIPAGTTNDFARALKIPSNKPLEAIKIVGKKQTLGIDVGKKDDQTHFINIAAAGALTELTFSVPSQLKTTFGYLAYIQKGAELLPRVKKHLVRITYDGNVIEEEISMFFCGLTNSVGGFENIAPDAQINDGLFTLILVKTDNFFELIALLAIVASGSGNHVNDVNVTYLKATNVKVEPLTDDKWMLNLDGEYGGEAPVEFVNLKGAIETFVNLDRVPDGKYIEEETLRDREIEEMAKKFIEHAAAIKPESLNELNEEK
ncbi:diacylglycerol kinase [Lactovum miscens]|uniref:Diacylglycerol kinase (ATP) n=1 Tax=Lactovum miscens TaxID=190387 RepID=A0A841C6E8_9LACT|nr:diacylglycerol kinase [Lactovum miscens]MBB5888035.1 diacylglycerol kinase (ATP) [Lactovum miscens]